MFEKGAQDDAGEQSGFKLTDTLDRRRVNAETTAWFHAHVGHPAKFSGKFNSIRGVSIRNTFSAATTNVQKDLPSVQNSRRRIVGRHARSDRSQDQSRQKGGNCSPDCPIITSKIFILSSI